MKQRQIKIPHFSVWQFFLLSKFVLQSSHQLTKVTKREGITERNETIVRRLLTRTRYC